MWHWFQCIVVSVGEEGFSTEEAHDFATFKDSNSDSGIKVTLIDDRQADRGKREEEICHIIRKINGTRNDYYLTLSWELIIMCCILQRSTEMVTTQLVIPCLHQGPTVWMSNSSLMGL